MEEDIKILEEWIEITIGNRPEWVKSDEILKIIDYKQIQALENLIKGYKTQEDIIKDLENDIIAVFKKGIADCNSWWKIKIKEKIEELEKAKQKYQEENAIDEVYCFEINAYNKAIWVLQELMGDK